MLPLFLLLRLYVQQTQPKLLQEVFCALALPSLPLWVTAALLPGLPLRLLPRLLSLLGPGRLHLDLTAVTTVQHGYQRCEVFLRQLRGLFVLRVEYDVQYTVLLLRQLDRQLPQMLRHQLQPDMPGSLLLRFDNDLYQPGCKIGLRSVQSICLAYLRRHVLYSVRE